MRAREGEESESGLGSDGWVGLLFWGDESYFSVMLMSLPLCGQACFDRVKSMFARSFLCFGLHSKPSTYCNTGTAVHGGLFDAGKQHARGVPLLCH